MIIFDNIVFSLQRAGGISVVWYELLKRILEDSRFNSQFLEYAGCTNNIFRKKLCIPDSAQLPTNNLLPVALQGRLLPHVHLNNKVLFHSSYYRILKDKKACNITTVHDFIYEKYRTGICRSLHVWQKTRAIQNSAAIICISQNTREDLLKYYPQIDPDRIFVIYNGVSEDFFRMEPADCDLPFPSGSYLLFVGARQGYKSFLPAIQSLKDTGVNLVIVGGLELSAEEIVSLDAAVGRGHYQRLKGIPNQQLNILYNNALALLYPSAYEGFGIPIIEAQKASCPVICRDTAISHEVAADTALFFSDFSEISSLLDKAKDSRELLISKGLKNASRFSWEKTYQETTSVYQKLLN